MFLRWALLMSDGHLFLFLAVGLLLRSLSLLPPTATFLVRSGLLGLLFLLLAGSFLLAGGFLLAWSLLLAGSFLLPFSRGTLLGISVLLNFTLSLFLLVFIFVISSTDISTQSKMNNTYYVILMNYHLYYLYP